jgi:hypothetical protein
VAGLVDGPPVFLLQHRHPVTPAGQLTRHRKPEDSAANHHNMSHIR